MLAFFSPLQITSVPLENQSENRLYHKMMLKLEKLAFVLPVTTRTSKQGQGWNLYGCFIQMLAIQKMTGYVPPKTILTAHFK